MDFMEFLSEDAYDLAIIGGGINGCGIARDAAGRGLKVYLCEQGDLGSATSSASSKLLHGGLRYLETREFRLVREALEERNIVLSLAPHIAYPLRFLLLYRHRPKWKIRCGLLLYDLLREKSEVFPRSQAIAIEDRAVFAPTVKDGFLYSDCWVDDSRLVVLNAVDAAKRGAVIQTRTRCVRARKIDNVWRVTVRKIDNAESTIYAKILVNAGGPWVTKIFADVLDKPPRRSTRLIKGGHIVVRRKPFIPQDLAYTLEHDDRRVVFSLPFEKEWRLIGTTEIPYNGDPSHASVSEEEIDYLCRGVNRYFKDAVRPEDVIATYSGVRPLLDDGNVAPSLITRDYSLDLDSTGLLSIYGGKLTTFRRLAEKTMTKLAPLLSCSPEPWTGRQPLSGGDIDDLALFEAQARQRYPWLDSVLLERYIHTYGSSLELLLGSAKSTKDLGEHLGDGLYETEVDYLRQREWAMTPEDVLWRRTKLGLRASPETVRNLTRWFESL